MEGIDNINKFIKKLQGLQKAPENMKTELKPYLTHAIQANITEKKHLKNAPLTLELKGNKHPLTDTGELRASINTITENDGLKSGTP